MELIDKEINEALEREINGSAYEMATIGYFREKKGKKPKGGLIKVFTTDDSGKPQVHFHLKSVDGELRSCIKLDKAEYFLHDEYKDKLTKEQIEGLIKFFAEPSTQPIFMFNGISYKLKTQWDYAVLQWNIENQLNPKVWLPIKLGKDGYVITPKQPDYTQLK